MEAHFREAIVQKQNDSRCKHSILGVYLMALMVEQVMIKTSLVFLEERKCLFLLLALTLSACAQEKAEKTETLDMMEQRLQGVLLDQDFFETLKKVKSLSETNGEAKDLLARFELSALAVALTHKNEALKTLFQSETPDRQRIALFVENASKEAQNPDVALALSSLSHAIAGQSTDLTKTIEVALGDSVFSAPVALLLAHYIVEALSDALTAPEYERGTAIQQSFPGIPTPPSNDPLEAVFPRTLRLLASLLEQGRKNEGLKVAFQSLKSRAEGMLSGKMFALPTVIDRTPRGGFPGSGIAGSYSPLLVAVIGEPDLSIVKRPVIKWDDNKVVLVVEGKPVPIAKAIDLDTLGEDKRKELVATINEHRGQVENIEKQLYPVVATGHSASIAFSNPCPAKTLFSGLSLLKDAGIDVFYFLVPGAPSRMLPFFFKEVPQGLKPKASAQVIVVLSKGGAEVYSSDPKKSLKVKKEWGNEVRAQMEGGKPVALSIAWDEERGFKGTLAMVLEEVSKGSHLVKLMVRTKDLPSVEVLDAVSEVIMAKGEPFPDISQFFSGVPCSGASLCPAFVPILVTEGSLPKPTKVVVEETRPLGFCDPKDVERVMKGRSGAFKACYELQLQRYPDLKGRLDLRFTIEEDGTTSRISFSTNELNTQVADCIRRHVESLKFPKPAGGICVIRWPFTFKPGGD
jgi:hypothetical protein